MTEVTIMNEKYELQLPDGTFDSKYVASKISKKAIYRVINELIACNAITRVGRGQYTRYIVNKKFDYGYKASENLEKVEKYIVKKFPEIDFQIGETYQLNWYVNHQISQNVIFVETEKMLTESVFFALKDKFDVLLKPNIKDFSNYIKNNTVIIQNLVSGAPKTKGTRIFTLEKLLVDVVCDKKYRNFVEEAELPGIYENAFDCNNINRAGMLRYAGRRSCREEIEKLMEEL